MTNSTTQKPPIWFWIVSIIGLIWNGMGVNAYLQQAYNTQSYQDMYTAEHLLFEANSPSYVKAAFAIAVFAGVLGFVFLLLRKKLGYTLLLVSLLAVAIQMSYYFIQDHIISLPMTLMIIIGAIIFLVFARFSKLKGWLN
ncbi:hypothetical protein [Olleya sp. R77988]|uniref:hypothetical protein n=1 Tax=Olleya sp. R77988 TaxID=3093875 RepID=UPI0037C550A1